MGEANSAVGKLILLTTPIGHLGDITERIHSALKNGENFLVEDTRHFKSLLNALGISLIGKNINSFHEHTTESKLNQLVEVIQSNDITYLCSDAGSPIISDPAYPLIKACYQHGVEVDSYPGVSSLIMALELSGLPPQPFHFHGFIPREEMKKQRWLESAQAMTGTHLFFESPQRVIACEKWLSSKGIKTVLLRELTKKFQQRCTDAEDIQPLGEFVVAFHIEKPQNDLTQEILEMSKKCINEGAKAKSMAKLLALLTSSASKDIYTQLLK